MADIEIHIIPDVNVINIEINENGYGSPDVLSIVGDNTNSYTESTLVGKKVLTIFIDAQKLSRNAYTFTQNDGSIDFDSVIDTGAEIDILYV
jgi:hypothetical protein